MSDPFLSKNKLARKITRTGNSDHISLSGACKLILGVQTGDTVIVRPDPSHRRVVITNPAILQKEYPSKNSEALIAFIGWITQTKASPSTICKTFNDALEGAESSIRLNEIISDNGIIDVTDTNIKIIDEVLDSIYPDEDDDVNNQN